MSENTIHIYVYSMKDFCSEEGERREPRTLLIGLELTHYWKKPTDPLIFVFCRNSTISMVVCFWDETKHAQSCWNLFLVGSWWCHVLNPRPFLPLCRYPPLNGNQNRYVSLFHFYIFFSPFISTILSESSNPDIEFQSKFSKIFICHHLPWGDVRGIIKSNFRKFWFL